MVAARIRMIKRSFKFCFLVVAFKMGEKTACLGIDGNYLTKNSR